MIRRAVVGIGVVALATVLAPTAAHADSAYRYWSYWTGGDQWAYSQRGPGFRVPTDKAVEGWRFVVSPKDGSQATPPTSPSQYDVLCPGAAAPPSGQKRVAVVIDSGAAGIAPVGETPPARSVSCVTVPAGQTGLQVLQSVAQLRFHTSGLICGIAGFPATECPGQAARTATPTPSGTSAVAPPPAPAAPEAPSTRSRPTTVADSPTPIPSEPVPTYAQPSPVALPLETVQEQQADRTAPPAWIAAIGAAMIAALLGLAVLARKGRG